MGIMNEVWLAVSYDAKALYMNANRRRKKRRCPDIKSEYRLELVSVNLAELTSVVAKEFGEILQNAGVEIVIADNDKKTHSKIVTDAWAKFGIKVWPGAGKVKDRTLITEFTGEDAWFRTKVYSNHFSEKEDYFLRTCDFNFNLMIC